ncbi:MAG: hypothetical protein U0325_22570 [Polyangiales bacterium]
MTTPHDAMLSGDASERAWRVLVGVTEALAQTLDPEAFARAVDALAPWADRFPDALRCCPMVWIDLFFAEAPDPRLRLVRGLSLSWSHFGWSAKNVAAWVSLLARSPHLAGVRYIELFSMQPSAPVAKAVAALFAAARPTHWRSLGSKAAFDAELDAELAAAGVTATRHTDYPVRGVLATTDDPAALAQPEVNLTVRDDATLEALLARDDLDHVVSLELRLDADAARVVIDPDLRTAAPRWTRLRHLAVHVPSDTPAGIAARLAAWLQHARPICIDLGWRDLTGPLLRAGVFARAYGTVLALHDLDDAAEALAADQVRVLGILRDANARYAPHDTTGALLARLSPGLKASLRLLDWRLAGEEFAQVEAYCASLPSLVLWCPCDAALTAQRDAFLAQLAAAPSTARLRLLIPHEAYRGAEKTPPLSAKQAKVLEAGRGLRPGAYVVYPHSQYPYLLAW